MCSNTTPHVLSCHLTLMMLGWTLQSSYGQVLPNVALGKDTYIWPKSPVHPGGEVVVDGNLNSNHNGGSCAHTNGAIQNKPWWKVDLGGDYVIRNVKILNRGDCPCYPRLSNFIVVVGFDNITISNNMLCHFQALSVGKGAWLDAICPQLLAGRFVIIQIIGPSLYQGQQLLSLCEVQVFATSLPTAFSGKRKKVSPGKRIRDHQLGVQFQIKSVGECAHSCWTSDQRRCVAFSFCTYQDSNWCYIGASYSVDFMEADLDCDTYRLTYHVTD